MARYNYSMKRRDKKLAGVCSTIGEVFNLDPTFIRVGFVAAAVLISWKLALIAYVGRHGKKSQLLKHLGGLK
jgi:phage shock protein PspC (stress-responsive transcriptional regulator)